MDSTPVYKHFFRVRYTTKNIGEAETPVGALAMVPVGMLLQPPLLLNNGFKFLF
jgi:hypothetical protein